MEILNGILPVIKKEQRKVYMALFKMDSLWKKKRKNVGTNLINVFCANKIQESVRICKL